jgi:hypothetical protein
MFWGYYVRSLVGLWVGGLSLCGWAWDFWTRLMKLLILDYFIIYNKVGGRGGGRQSFWQCLESGQLLVVRMYVGVYFIK